MRPSNGVLCIAAMRLHHLVERRNPVALFELRDTLPNTMNGACRIISLWMKVSIYLRNIFLLPYLKHLIERGKIGHPFRYLPIFRVTAASDDLDHDLAWLRLWDGRVHDLNFGSLCDERFFHGGMLEMQVIDGRDGTVLLSEMIEKKEEVLFGI